MTRLITDGFEHQKIPTATLAEYTGVERAAAVATVTVNTANPRSGAACFSFGPSAINGVAYSSLTTTLDSTYYYKAAIRFNAVPSVQCQILDVRAAGSLLTLRLNTTGTLRVYDSVPTALGSPTAALSVNTWYVVELQFVVPTAGNGTVSLVIDGVPEVNNQALSGNFLNASFTALRAGHLNAGETATTMLVDDVMLNDNQGSPPDNTYPGVSKIVWLLPTTDNAVGTGWLEADGTSDALYTNVDNTPPTGVTATPTTGATQIKNASASASALNYDANAQSYTANGIAHSDLLIATRMIARAAGSSATGTNDAILRVVSNPADAADTTSLALFDSVAGADSSTPTTWRTGATSRVIYPDIVRGTAPVIRIGKNANTTRVAQVDQMALEVEYLVGGNTLTPLTMAPPAT